MPKSDKELKPTTPDVLAQAGLLLLALILKTKKKSLEHFM